MVHLNPTKQLSENELRELIPQLQQLTEKYKHSESIQKALFDISEVASSVGELSLLYPAIHSIIGNFMNAENFFVAFYESDSNLIDFVYFVDQFDEQVLRQVPAEQLMDGVTGYILKTGTPQLLNTESIRQLGRQKKLTLMGAESANLIGVPLKRGSQVIGVMVVQSYDQAVTYSQEDLEVLLFVSQHIVNSVDRVKNRELTARDIRQRTKQLRKINEELQDEIFERQKIESLQQTLFEISELAANVDGDMAHFYASLHEILSRLVSAPNCYIATLDETRSKLNFPYFSDELNNSEKSRNLGLGLTEYVLRSGQAELINPARVLELAASGELDASTAKKMISSFNSWLGSPLVVDGNVVGVIAIQTYGELSGYTSKDLELLRFVSHHIAVAMERKKSSEAIQRYNQQLEEMVRARTEELNKTNQHLQQQIEERKQIERKLIHDAHHDNLTDLPNRAMFNSRLELAIANKKRYLDHNFAVLFIDLDRFKLINDTLGHHAGDEFLIEVSSRLTSCIRSHDLLARLGGDEFVILSDSFEEMADVEEVANRIICSLSAPFALDDKQMYSGASIGIAYIEVSYSTAEEVIRDADAAMYQAKALGRGRFVIFDKSMRKKLLEELELENEFRRALQASEFTCYVQPAMRLSDKHVIYHECYIRWTHPSFGKVKREQFRQVIEQSGLTLQVDNYLLEYACDMLDNWQRGTIEERSRCIAINISVTHLLQSKLVNQLVDYIEQRNIEPGKLAFEFDENDLNMRSQYLLPEIKKLKRAGVLLVLDNFGSGLASLSYLYSYPFDFVKIDHRFVKSVPRSQRNLKLIQSVILISEHLKFKLIAEGIQSQEQQDALLAIGCEYGQGNYLAPSRQVEQLEVEASAAS